MKVKGDQANVKSKMRPLLSTEEGVSPFEGMAGIGLHHGKPAGKNMNQHMRRNKLFLFRHFICLDRAKDALAFKAEILLIHVSLPGS